MTKSFVNIVATLLLLIFPITAVGLDMSIYRCKHNGAFDVELFASRDRQHAKSCNCSTHAETKIAQEAKPAVKEEIKVEKKHSCCSKHKKNDSQETKPQVKTEEHKSVIDKKNSVIKSGACCVSSNVHYLVSAPSMPIFVKDNLFASIAINPILKIEPYLNSEILKKNAFKEVLYPKKEPINDLIAFIHFSSSSLSGEDYLSIA